MSPELGTPFYGEGVYGGPEVCKLVGISYRQLDYWARTAMVMPSVQMAYGSAQIFR